MNAAQGVILVMGAALVLYLMWSAQSPFNQTGTSSPGPVAKSNPGIGGRLPGWTNAPGNWGGTVWGPTPGSAGN